MIYIYNKANNTITTDSWTTYIPSSITLYLNDIKLGSYLNESTNTKYIVLSIPSADLVNIENTEYNLKLVNDTDATLIKVEVEPVVSPLQANNSTAFWIPLTFVSAITCSKGRDSFPVAMFNSHSANVPANVFSQRASFTLNKPVTIFLFVKVVVPAAFHPQPPACNVTPSSNTLICALPLTPVEMAAVEVAPIETAAPADVKQPTLDEIKQLILDTVAVAAEEIMKEVDSKIAECQAQMGTDKTATDAAVTAMSKQLEEFGKQPITQAITETVTITPQTGFDYLKGVDLK